jgi:hypothetical protein
MKEELNEKQLINIINKPQFMRKGDENNANKFNITLFFLFFFFLFWIYRPVYAQHMNMIIILTFFIYLLFLSFISFFCQATKFIRKQILRDIVTSNYKALNKSVCFIFILAYLLLSYLSNQFFLICKNKV